MATWTRLLILAAWAGAAWPATADDWPSFGGNPRGHRRAPEPGVSEFLAPEWQFTLPPDRGGIVSSPVSADGYVFIGARDGRVRCFRVDAETPKLPVWEYATADLVDSTPAVFRGRCYVAGRDGRVYCLDAETGALLWLSVIGGGNVSSPVIVTDPVDPDAWSVAVGTGFPSDGVVSLDGKTGAFRFFMSMDQPVFSSPVVDETVGYIGSNDGRLYAFDAAFGAAVAAFKDAGGPDGSVATTGRVLLSSPLILDSGAGPAEHTVCLVPGGFDNHLYGWGAADGAPRFTPVDLDLVSLKGKPEAFKPAAARMVGIWDRQAQLRGRPRFVTKEAPSGRFRKPDAGAVLPRGVPGPYSVDTYASSPALQPGLLGGKDVVYAVWGAQTGAPVLSLVAVRMDTGTGVWRHPLGDGTAAPYVPSPAAAADLVFAAKPVEGKLIALGAADEAARGEWTLDGGILSSPCIANGRLFIATLNGSVYAFAGDTASPTPANRPPAAVTGGLNPSGFINMTDNTPTLTWAVAADPEGDPVSYLVRADDDGEVLRDWDFENFADNSAGGAPVTTFTIPAAIPDDRRITWRVRSRDSKAPGATSGAWSPWSAPQVFFVNRSSAKPFPATDLLALPRDARVDLRWQASPSNDVRTYRLWVAPTGQAFTTFIDVGDVLEHSVGLAQDGIPLTNGVLYAFKLVAVDFDGQESDAVSAQAVPAPAVRLNGVASADLPTAAAVAQSGDLIQLGAETFTLTQPITLREGVFLAGHAPGFSVIDGAGLGTLIRLTDGGAGASGGISGVTLRNGGTGIDSAGADIVVRNVVFVNLLRGIDVRGNSTVQAINDTFAGLVTAGVVVSGAGGSATLRNDLFIRNTGFAVMNLGGTITGGYNDFWFNRGTADGTDDTMAYPGFATDLALDVDFIDEPEEDFREAYGSSAVDAGDPADLYDLEPLPSGARINLGAFGNTAYAARSAPLTSAPPPGPDPPPPGGQVTDPTAPSTSLGASGGGGNGSGGACAVTTAAYGTVASEKLVRFYQLRDETLRTNLLGSDLVKLYYRISPPVAETVGESEALRLAVRRALGPGE